MKILLSICISLLVTSPFTIAQDSDFDDLTLNGLASYVKLRKEYYIGALYLEYRCNNCEDVTAVSGNKRMDIRIAVDKWSPRRFSKEWRGSILLSNPASSLEQLTSQIQSFTNIPTDDLVSGDRITIDMAEGRHTTIYLNNNRVFRTINNDFFYALLNTWVGSKPPSTDFKDDILNLPRDENGFNLLGRYEELNYSDSRKSQVAAWSNSASNSSAGAENSAFAPPSSSTSATRSSSAAQDDQAAKQAATAKKAAEAQRKADALVLAKAKADIAAAQAAATAATEALRKAEAEKARDNALGQYQSQMYQVISKNVRYPSRSQQRGERGRVVIKVELDREGKIVTLSQEASANYARLNDAAEKAFRVSEPFEPISKDIEGETFEFIFPINF